MSLTPCDHRIHFVSAWDDPSEQLDLEIIAPDGYRYTPSSPGANRLVRYVDGPGYAFYELMVPKILDAPVGIIGPDVLGTWTLRVSAGQLNGSSQRFITSVLVDSEINMRAQIPPVQIGESSEVHINLSHGELPLTHARIKVSLIYPEYGTEELLQAASDNDITEMHEEEAPDPAVLVDSGSAAVLQWRSLRPLMERCAEPRTEEFHAEPMEDGCSYTVRLPPLDRDGIYEVVIEAEAEACGGKVTRYAAYSLLPSRQLDPEYSEWEVEQSSEGSEEVILFVTPRDQAGNRFGVGYADAMEFEVEEGLALAGIRDLFNGSYEVRLVRIETTAQNTAVLRLRGGELSITVPPFEECAR